jgi:hypothetical protein
VVASVATQKAIGIRYSRMGLSRGI